MDLANTLLEEATTALFPILLFVLTAAIKAWMDTHSAGAAVEAVKGALERAAAIGAQELVDGRARDVSAAAKGMVEYVERGVPGAVAKLKPAEGALAQMATAVLLQVLQDRQDKRDARAVAAPAGA